MRPALREIAPPDDHASIAYYKKIYDRVSALGRIGVWECELPSGRLTWTDAVYDLFDIPRGSPLNRAEIVELYEPESRAKLEKIRQESIIAATGFALDAKIITPKGNHRWIRITADIEMDNGRPARIFGTKQDVTAERAARDEVQLLQTELIHVSRVNAMSAMASTLAHELNQPLTAISNYLLAARRISSPDAAGEDLTSCIEGARSSAMRAGEIIRRLRDMTVKGQTSHERFGVRTAIEETVALASGGRPDLQVSIDCSRRLELVADRIQIQQVLLNLIQNSYEAAAGKHCRVWIAAAAREGFVEVNVGDDGPGISEELLPHIFESLVTTKASGMGIGLSVSRTIIETHGGRMWVRNTPGRGACISFELPEQAEEGSS